MRTYTITDPQGVTHSIDGPEGATREQVIAKIKERLSFAPAQQQARDPYTETAQKQSFLENALAGAGGAAYGLYLGGKQLLGKATPQEIAEHKRAMEGLRSTGGGVTGEILGSIGTAAPAALIPGAGTALGAIAAGGGLGAFQPVGENDSRGTNIAMGAAGGLVGNALGRAIGRVLQPIPKNTNSGTQAGIAAANRLGIGSQLTPGQRTGNLSLQQVEAVLSRTPGAAGRFDAIKKSHQTALNRAAAKAIGENADDLSESVIARASDRIGKQFNNLSAKSNVVLDKSFPALIKNLESTNAMLGPFRNPQIDSLVEKSVQLAQMQSIPGNVYQTIRSELTSSADDAFRAGNSSAGRALKQVRDALDDAAKSGLSAADQKAWDQVRREYANLSTLLKGKTIKSGDVDQNLINNAMIKYNNKLYKSGAINSPMNDIGKYAEAFKTTVPNSGTPERTFMQNMMFGNPLTGLPTAAAANLYGRAYMSQPMQQYLTNGLMNLSPAARAAMQKYGGIAGGAMSSQLSNQ